jgi:hypothetical protein
MLSREAVRSLGLEQLELVKGPTAGQFEPALHQEDPTVRQLGESHCLPDLEREFRCGTIAGACTAGACTAGGGGAAGALMATAAFYPIASYPTSLIGNCAARLSDSFAEKWPLVLKAGWSRSTRASTLLRVW